MREFATTDDMDIVQGMEKLSMIPSLESYVHAICNEERELTNSDPVVGLSGSNIDAAISFGAQTSDSDGLDSEDFDDFEDSDLDDCVDCDDDGYFEKDDHEEMAITSKLDGDGLSPMDRINMWDDAELELDYYDDKNGGSPDEDFY